MTDLHDWREDKILHIGAQYHDVLNLLSKVIAKIQNLSHNYKTKLKKNPLLDNNF